MNRPLFATRGVIEGFYGPFYTAPERNDLIRFIGQHGYNLYIYAPKNDRQHRSRWRQPYPQEMIAQFAQSVAVACEAGVTFCYAISPIDYRPEHDFEPLTTKLRSLYDCGVRAFSLLVDDISCTAHQTNDCPICQEGSHLHAQVCNRLLAWLHALDPDCSLSMCPTYYHGTAPFGSYLHDLGAQLDPAIEVFYTGPEICSPTITAADAQAFGQAVRRKPLIWDNYPVNDLAMRPNLHLGPIRGRDAALHETTSGVVVNLMLQAEASKIALLTFADFFADPQGYEPWQSWDRAMAEVGGRDSFPALHAFAENSLDSCLGRDHDSRLKQLADAALAEIKQGDPSQREATRHLARHLDSLDEHCYFLKHRLPNLRLRANLLPWIETLEHWIWLGKDALAVLDLIERDQSYERRLRSMKESLQLVAGQATQIAGLDLLPLVMFVLEHAELVRMRQQQPMLDGLLPLLALDPGDREPGELVPDYPLGTITPAS